MTPSAIVTRAKAAGLDMIAICDHNSTENTAAVARAGERHSLAVIPGIEMCSREEVHVLGLFKGEEARARIQSIVEKKLPGENTESIFGAQTLVDQWDQVTGSSTRLLIGATDLGLEQVVEAIHDCGGLAVAAHIDRQRFSVIGQLGFIPEGLPLDAVEVSPACSVREHKDFPVIRSSDAHCLGDIGKCSTSFFVNAPTLDEIGMALHERGGRRMFVTMEDLSLHILDIVENSLTAGATRVTISLTEDTPADTLSLQITDNGRGMDATERRQALDPFYTTRTTRRVGLGLSLLAQAAQQCEGCLELESEPDKGTVVRAVFRMSHPDMKPFGDISETLRTILTGCPDLDLQFEYTKDGELIAKLGG